MSYAQAMPAPRLKNTTCIQDLSTLIGILGCHAIHAHQISSMPPRFCTKMDLRSPVRLKSFYTFFKRVLLFFLLGQYSVGVNA